MKPCFWLDDSLFSCSFSVDARFTALTFESGRSLVQARWFSEAESLIHGTLLMNLSRLLT